MCDLFSTTAEQDNKTNSSQTGTSSTQNNAWDTIKPFLTNYMQQYNSGNVSSTGTPNLYQDEAGGNQGAVANPSTLQAGFNAATNVAGNGITTADIQSYMSPYIQNVVNPTLQAQDIQNKQAISNMRGNQAAQHALGNNTGAEAAYYAGVQPGQQQQIASLYDQGFNKAVDTAGTSAGLKLQGASGLGNLSNAASGANRTLYDIGQGIYNTSLTPYELMTKGVSGLAGLAGLAGSKVSTTGNSTGHSSGTTSSSPSLGSIILGGIGTAMSGFRRGGAVPAYADGGGVSSAAMMPFMPGDDMATKVGRAFKMLHGLKTAAQGGTIDHYDVGGVVPYGAWDQPSPIGTEVGGPIGEWETTVTSAPSSPAYSTKKVGQTLAGVSDKLGSADHMPNMGDGGLGQSQAGLSQFLGGLASSVRPAYEDGGMVPAYNEDTDSGESSPGFSLPSFLDFSKKPAPAEPPREQAPLVDAASTPNASGWLPTYSTGVWAGQAPSPMQRFASALAQVGDGPFAPFGKAIMEQQNARLKDLEAQRAARALGMDATRLGMEQKIFPSKMAQAAAEAKKTAQEADLDYQIRAAEALGNVKLAAELRKAKAVWDMTNSPEVAGGVSPNPTASPTIRSKFIVDQMQPTSGGQ